MNPFMKRYQHEEQIKFEQRIAGKKDNKAKYIETETACDFNIVDRVMRPNNYDIDDYTN